MNFYDYLDAINCELTIKRFPCQQNRWIAFIDNAEIKEGAGLSSEYGNGNSSKEAVKDYIKKIRGKLLIIYAYKKERRELMVPDTLTINDL